MSSCRSISCAMPIARPNSTKRIRSARCRFSSSTTAVAFRRASRSAGTSKKCSLSPPLFGVGAREQALVEMWNRRIELEIFAPVGHVWSHLSKVAEGRGRRIPELGEIQKRAAIARIAWLDTRAQESRIHCGRQILNRGHHDPVHDRLRANRRYSHRARTDEPRAMVQSRVVAAERESLDTTLPHPRRRRWSRCRSFRRLRVPPFLPLRARVLRPRAAPCARPARCGP